ncbi:glycosyl transferase group 1 [Stanieria cyanosphaera PCC 7437]|uniref:Glycosyl transferase group 1 n=1 Tax=Stanieria cyanosphaera (strain ATCC 29371 / PCC 7437) TaxID=111780 RepID=K9Y038_STAC7|nr:glycosyltransferase family 4 protein [Stanieria cyanosphaera]AFZ37649.1 glycosyl transferase group 1 [Stanieria cyanosphaera PCC 7437]
MKILFPIARADTIAGAQVHVKDLAIALQQDRHQVLVVTGKTGIYNLVLEQAGIKSIACETLEQKISPIQDLASLRFLIKTIRQFQPDLIAAHSSKTGVLGRLAAKITNKPCVFTAHNWSFTLTLTEPGRTIYQVIEQFLEPLTAKIICVSESSRQIGIKSGMNPERLVTIYNGMPDISVPFQVNLSYTKPIKILMVARFAQPKDHFSLIKAFKDIPAAELILVGDGPDLEKIKTQVAQWGIAEKVKFMGFCNDVADILAQAQIFTLISDSEGLPCSIIEAMRAGLPVVASEVGGIPEIVLDKVTGYIIPRGDVNQLHQRLLELVNNAQLRQNMGKAGRLRYESNFTFEQMYQKTLKVYEQVILTGKITGKYLHS